MEPPDKMFMEETPSGGRIVMAGGDEKRPLG